MEPDRWLGIELRHLTALEAVSRTGSFGRAAKSLGYTQSAVSQQIAALERIVGARLVERPGGPRPVSLTEAGEPLPPPPQAIRARPPPPPAPPPAPPPRPPPGPPPRRSPRRGARGPP